MVNRHNKLKLSLIKYHEVIGICAGHAIITLSLTMTNACPTLCDPKGLQPARLLCPWDSPGKKTGLGCHALLQGVPLTQG